MDKEVNMPGLLEALVETKELLSIPGFKRGLKRSLDQIEKGETYSMEDIFKCKNLNLI